MDIDALLDRIDELEKALESAVEAFEDKNRDDIDLAWYRDHIIYHLSAEAKMRLTVRRNREEQ